MTAAEAARSWGVSLEYARRLLRSGRVPGAERAGREWYVPDHAPKPTDPPNLLTDEERRRIARRLDAGESATAIGRELDTERSNVYKTAKKFRGKSQNHRI